MNDLSPLKSLAAVTVLDATVPTWPMLEASEEPRHFRQAVTFATPFSSPPVVHVGLVGLDASKDDNLRIRVRAQSITPEGFEIEVESWLHTRLWSVEVGWLALGT